MSLRELEILVVGGTGGIGAEVTRTLAEAGALVTATYRANAARASALSSVARLEQADLAVANDRARILDGVRNLYGLVILAGDPARPSDTEAAEVTMARSHEVNYAGPILMAQEAAERMRQRKMAGAIVMVSTMQAAALFPNSTLYAAQKAAMVYGARILAKETRGSSGIRVNVISPGIIDAGHAGMARTSISSGKYDRFIRDGMIGRFGRPSDIACAAAFLLEPDNYITGQVLCIDGGITL